MMRIHIVSSHTDGIEDHFFFLAMILSHHQIAHHSTGFSYIQLILPPVAIDKLIFA